MKLIGIASLALLGYFFALAPAWAADTCKDCQDFQRACVKAHSQAACKTDYDICA
jgi:hypothetical protein